MMSTLMVLSRQYATYRPLLQHLLSYITCDNLKLGCFKGTLNTVNTGC